MTTLPVSKPCTGARELGALHPVLESGWLGLGSTVKDFEDAVSDSIGTSHFLAVSSGTAALHLALEVLDLDPGDEVIVPSLTFVACPQAIRMARLIPVFCDVDPMTLTMDVDDVARLIGPRTKAIMPVHYRGCVCNMGDIGKVARDARVHIVEDAAHAFGARYRAWPVGAISELTCFSFDPIKNLTCGEGGGIAFIDPKLYDRAHAMRNLGINKDAWNRQPNMAGNQYDVISRGYRYHMSNISAAIGLAQLQQFATMCARRIEIAKQYDKVFTGLPDVQTYYMSYEESIPFTYILGVQNRPEFMSHMRARGIDTGIHYRPCHEFSHFNCYRRSELTITRLVSNEIVSIPLFPDMKRQHVDKVIEAVGQYVG